MKQIWGFDLGTASVGFAVIEHDEESQTGKILRLGVRVFPEAVTEKSGEPRNWARRASRLSRRQFRRRRRRKQRMRAALVEAGLLPDSERLPRSRQADGEFFLNSAGRDPYELRARGLQERLELYDFGRALFHLARHRAFMGSRKFADAPGASGDRIRQERNEEKRIQSEIQSHQETMRGRTIGEYLHQDFPAPSSKRGKHFSRQMVEDEFNRLWAAQRKFHSEVLDDQLRDKVHQIIFSQRPTFFRMNTIGTCELEPGHLRCLKADWYAQRFISLQMLNNLRLSGGRQLTCEQRRAVSDRIEAKARVSFASLRKALSLGDQRFNSEVGGKKEMLGNATEEKLVGVFKQDWSSLPARDQIRDQIAERLWHVEYRLVGKKRAEIRDAADIRAEREKFASAAQRDWGITAEQAKALSELSLPDGYVMHSKCAIRKMLPYLEKGLRYDEAKAAAYPEQPRTEGRALPPLDPGPTAWGRKIRNPTVTRTLNELRSVAKNLLRVYGCPDIIRVELARDLRLSREKRLELVREQKRNESRREKAKQVLAQQNLEPNPANVEKWLLAEEQGWRCPYSGQTISVHGLFVAGQFQVDHILPLSRSLDDSFANKVVCHRDANVEKAKRTPYEAWGGGERWEEIQRYIRDLKQHNEFPQWKIDRINTVDYPKLGSEQFTSRQLVDTAYASRLAREYLQTLGVKVEPTNGRVTKTLRHLWGLNLVLSEDNEKNRADHRHHAIDALVASLTTPAFIKRAAEYYAADIRPHDETLSVQLKERAKQSFPAPWPNIREDARVAAEKIVVSHRAERKVSGKLNEPNPWRATGRAPNDAEDSPYRVYTQRKEGRPVEEQIQPSFMKAIGPDKAQWVRTNFTDSTHHMVIYADDSGQLRFQAVTKIAAAGRVRRREAIVERVPEAGARFLMSLCKGDTLEETVNGRKEYLVVRSLWSNGQVTVQPHNLGQNLERTNPKFSTLLKRGARKVVVDPIGRIFSAND